MIFPEHRAFWQIYRVSPSRPRLRADLEAVRDAFLRPSGTTSAGRTYDGLVRFGSSKQFHLARRLIARHPSPGVPEVKVEKRAGKTNALACTPADADALAAVIAEILEALARVTEERAAARRKVLTVMEAQPLVDQRALFQLFTADSKRRPVRWIKDQPEFGPRGAAGRTCRYFLDHKATSQPCFAWSRRAATFTFAVPARPWVPPPRAGGAEPPPGDVLTYAFTTTTRVHHLPLFARVHAITGLDSARRVVVVENTDTAVALAYLSEHHHPADLILCAGGENNAGENFARLLEQVLAHLPAGARVDYFGDFDLNGVKIYDELVAALARFQSHPVPCATRPPLGRRLPPVHFLVLPPELYEELLVAFGKPFPGGAKGKTKRAGYDQLVDRRDAHLDGVRHLLQLNLRHGRELEQNVLAYLADRRGRVLRW